MEERLARETAQEALRAKFARLSELDPQQIRAWWDRYASRIRTLTDHPVIRDFVFEPVKGVFVVPGEGEVARVRGIITTVALVNAVLAGLPGKLGIGVAVSIGLELYMAWAIARALGLALREPEDVWKVLRAGGLAAASALFLFKQVLSLVYTAVGLLTNWFVATNLVLALAELVTTNFFGVVFLVGFREIRDGGAFRVPLRTLKTLGSETVLLVKHQAEYLRNIFDPQNLDTVRRRAVAWFRGEVPTDMPQLRGELAATVAMSWLLTRQFENLQGPLGQEFLGAIRDRFPDLADGSIEQIAEKMSEYDPEQLAGVINLVKGKLFERLVAQHENQDSDDWRAVLHEDESWPGSDLTLVNDATGESLEVSLKTSAYTGYLEEALTRYPDVPILATDEVAESLRDNPMVAPAGWTNEEVTRVTQDNFDELLGQLEGPDALDVAATGVATKTAIGLWPFAVAFMKGRINREQLTQACTAALGESGRALAARLSYAVVLGPFFAWWLLARGVMLVTRDDRPAAGQPKRMLLMA